MGGCCCANSHPAQGSIGVGSLPSVEVVVNGIPVVALLDTGCTTSLVQSGIAGTHYGKTRVEAFDGKYVDCLGKSKVEFEVGGKSLMKEALVVNSIVCNFKAVIGMDIIHELGGVMLGRHGIEFGEPVCAAVSNPNVKAGIIEDKDFSAKFNGSYWTVDWKWIGDRAPVLKCSVQSYDKTIADDKRLPYEKEVERWIEEGILKKWHEDVDEGLLPLMAVEQPTKGKVRPVFDYRELNQYVSCHTGDDNTDICSEKLREWRKIEGNAEIVDLKCAYMQIRVSPELWKYQLVKYKGTVYCLTRLGFGLNSAPRIMSKILKTVLSYSKEVYGGTSSYIDDVMVNVSKVSSSRVVEHLVENGLECKPPEPLKDGSALGLKLQLGAKGMLEFGRGNEIPKLTAGVTRRQLFSMCGKLVGHYPVASWLRVSCSYVKRRAQGARWEDYIGDYAFKMMHEIVERVSADDPVRGVWKVPNTGKGRVWCDASDLALGVLLEIDGFEVEDGAWLRKQNDYNHINVAELEGVLKGVNLAVKWGLSEIEVMTDSVTVQRWIELTLSEERRIKTKGAAEIVIKRRLGVLKSLIEELGLTISVKAVSSQENKADILTRVKKSWLLSEEDSFNCAAAVDLRENHEMHHMGVDRSLYLARKADPSVTREAVKAVVRSCRRCQSIDPAPVTHSQGQLSVGSSWKRVAIDVTHYRHKCYLTLVDCGPGRYAIWREMKNETADSIVTNLDQIFYERGPVEQILMDNATAFRSEKMANLLKKWNIKSWYRAAYKASGNGIVERHHRTVKALAERGGFGPVQAVFSYNVSPKKGQDQETVPQISVHPYEWRLPWQEGTNIDESEEQAVVQEGDEVWLKPPESKCTTEWTRGTVTKVNSHNNIEVEGMPRHILDVRPVRDMPSEEGREMGEVEIRADEEDLGAGEETEDSEQVDSGRQHLVRHRKPPPWLADYDIDRD